MIRLETDPTGRECIVSDEGNVGRANYALVVSMLSLNMADGSILYAGGRLGDRDIPMVERLLKKRGVPAAKVFVGNG